MNRPARRRTGFPPAEEFVVLVFSRTLASCCLSLSLVFAACASPNEKAGGEKKPRGGGGSMAKGGEGAVGGTGGENASPTGGQGGNAGGAPSEGGRGGEPGPSPGGQGGIKATTTKPPGPPAEGLVGAKGAKPPAGMVGLFVASGNGGRTVISCDDGKTWVGQNKLSDSNGVHEQGTHKGFAHGNGKLVQLMGWGEPPSVKVSEDGVNWTRKSVAGKENGTIVFDGEVFVIANTGGAISAVNPAGTWSSVASPKHGGHIRGGGGGPNGTMRGAVAGGGSGEIPVASWDGGKSWARVSGCPKVELYNLGQYGGAAFGAGKLLIVSETGEGCVQGAKGAKAVAVKLPTAVKGKIDWLGDRFVAASITRLFSSPDGITWKTTIAQPGGTIKVQDVDVSDKGTFVAISDANAFYRSEDGSNWRVIPGPNGGNLIDLEWVHAKPSTLCPAK